MCTHGRRLSRVHETRTHTVTYARFVASTLYALAIGVANAKEDERALTSRLGKRIIAGPFIRLAKGPHSRKLSEATQLIPLVRFAPDLRIYM